MFYLIPIKNFRYCIGILIFLLLLPNGSLIAQNELSKDKISCAEKWWVVFHPFVAKKAYGITVEVLHKAKEMNSSPLLDGFEDGGQVDAFKHAYWMARLSKEIGWRKAKRLGIAHEKGNYRSFKKAKRKSQNDSHDKAGTDMDLWNNQQGIEIVLAYPEAESVHFDQLILRAVLDGKMKIIKRNEAGDFLDENGQKIPKDQLYGKWDNGKVLVPSDYPSIR